MTYLNASRRMVFVGAIGAFFLFSPVSLLSTYAQDQGFCAALLSEHPDGGAGLQGEVQNLVAAAPDVAQDVLGCAGSANKAQTQAIGAGLAKIVASLKETNPDLADKIAELVAGSGSDVLKTAYLGGDSEEAPAAIDEAGDGADTGGDAGDAFAGGPSAPTLTVGSSGGGTGGGSVSPN